MRKRQRERTWRKSAAPGGGGTYTGTGYACWRAAAAESPARPPAWRM